MDKVTPTHKTDAIMATIAYFSLFQFPLTKEEVARYLLWYTLSTEEIEKEIPFILMICEYKGYYCLKGKESDVDHRLGQENAAQLRIKKAYRFLPWLRFIPFIRGVFICNNLPYGITTEEGDIDLFIITKDKHIFLTRFCVTFWLHILGVRRHGEKIKNRFCLSFYSTQQRLNLSSVLLQPQDIYLAYWTRGLLPIIDHHVTQQMQEQNKEWLSSYFPIEKIGGLWHNEAQRKNIWLCGNFLQKGQEWLWASWTGRWLEKKIEHYQKQRMHKHYDMLPHKDGTVLTDDMLKFHDEDKRKEYQKKWINSLNDYDKKGTN